MPSHVTGYWSIYVLVVLAGKQRILEAQLVEYLNFLDTMKQDGRSVHWTEIAPVVI